MNKPEYIQDLENEQAEMKKMLMQIHICLMGTEYEKNGGLVSDVKKLKTDVKELKIWKIRMIAIGSTVSAILGGLFTFFASRLNGIKDLLE